MKTAIILAAAGVAKEFQGGELAALAELSTDAHKAVTHLTEVIDNMRSFMHEVPLLLPVDGGEQHE